MADFKIWCLVNSTKSEKKSEKAFSVQVRSDDTVDDLKKAIKVVKPNYYEKIDADDLALWRVEIPAKNLPILIQSLKDDETLLDSLQEEQKEQEEQEKQKKKTKLHEMAVISDVFKEKPPTSTIHIIVQLPQPGNATFCLMQAFSARLM